MQRHRNSGRLPAVADALLKEAAEAEKLTRQHDRTVGELEALGERRLVRAGALLRDRPGALPAVGQDGPLGVRQADVRVAGPDPLS